MFERFTDRARRVIVLAQEEARLNGNSTIFTFHILLGLIKEDEGVAATALKWHGFTYEGMKEVVAASGMTNTCASPPAGHIPFSEHAQRTLQDALREALQIGHNYIGTEHILLSICKHIKEGYLQDSVVDAMLDKKDVRPTVLQLLRGVQTPAETELFETAVLVKFGDQVVVENGNYEDVVSAVKDDLESGKLKQDDPLPMVFEVQVLRQTQFSREIVVTEY